MTHADAGTTSPLAAALARRPDCPPLGKLVEAATRPMAAEAARALREHAAGCPACAAELELAAAFQSPAESAESADLEWIVGQFAQGTSTAPAPARVLELRRRAPLTTWGLRAAAVALVTVGLGVGWSALRSRVAPALPDAGLGDVVRSGRVVTLAPSGALATPPESFAWEAVARAATYRVELSDVADEPIWEGEASATTLALPGAIRARLETLVTYRWRVIARDANGSRLAQSEVTEFRLDPEARLVN